MKSFFLMIFLICPAIWAQDEVSLRGEWQLTGMVYHGQEIPPLNPKLKLTWTFFENGTDRLYWHRADEEGFCERFAHFRVVDNQLQENVFAVNPTNRDDCAQDTDMQVGRITANPIEIQTQRILLHLQMGEEELIYILTENP